jgi:hypothetical protein
MEGRASDSKDWDDLISPKGNGDMALRREPKYIFRDEFIPGVTTWCKTDNSDLCPAIYQTLDDVMDKFGDMDQREIVEYTHTLGEWQDPGDKIVPIKPEAILKAMGRTPKEIEGILLYLEDARQLRADLA